MIKELTRFIKKKKKKGANQMLHLLVPQHFLNQDSAAHRLDQHL